MHISVSVHANDRTEIARNLPTEISPGGWVNIGEVTVFAPHEDPAAFWRYLSNVAADMAAYAEQFAAKQ